MKKIISICAGILPFILLGMSFLIVEKNGNNVTNAILLDGEKVSIDTKKVNDITASGQLPFCNNREDIFFKHIASSKDNKLIISMESASIMFSENMDYQVLKAPNGNNNNLEEVTCSYYNIPLITGGSFTLEIENINPNDIYYLRIYKPKDLVSVLLKNLIKNTTITMNSVFEPALVYHQVGIEANNLVVKSNVTAFQLNALPNINNVNYALENAYQNYIDNHAGAFSLPATEKEIQNMVNVVNVTQNNNFKQIATNIISKEEISKISSKETLSLLTQK